MTVALPDLDTLLQERLDGHFGSELFIEAAQTGDQISASDLKAIRQWTRGEIPAEDLYVFPVLAIDTAPTRNMVIYSEDTQRKSVNKWKGITFLFNDKGTAPLFSGGADHTLQAASQYARIFKSKLVKTPKGTIGTLVWVYTVKGISEDVDAFIKKIDAGILREVSIHVQASGVQCSICKAPFAECKEAHYPGDTYNGKVCYMETVGACTPLELSAVACPGSLAAHVMPDDEVDDYQVLSLREALGGADAALQFIQEQIVKTEDQSPEVEGAELVENAPNAESAELEEGKNKPKNDPPEDDAEDEEAADDDADDEQPKNGKKGSKQSLGSLFTGDCPACGRGEHAEAAPRADSDVIAEIRTEAATRVGAIMEAHTNKVSELQTLAEAHKEKADERDAMFNDIVAETVETAIRKGVKEDSAREDYTQELAALSYAAVKQIRETLAVVSEKTVTPVKRLEETIQQRFKQNFGGTQASTESGGRTSISTPRKPRLVSPIGPQSK